MLGENLKRIREQKNISLETASNKTGISVTDLEKYESNEIEPGTDTLINIAHYYKVTVEEIRWGRDAKASVQTMFPKNSEPAFSYLADWRILTGALLMFVGLGGTLLSVMRSIGMGYTYIADIFDYSGFSLLIFGSIFILGIIICIIVASIRNRKKKKHNGKHQKEN